MIISAPRTVLGQILAYSASGGALTALHTVSYWVLAEAIKIDPYLANVIAATLAGISGYFLHSKWTFGHTNDSGGGLRAQSRYLTVSLLCFALNSFWVWLFIDRNGLSVTWSIVPMVLVTPWLGFVLNRYWTFSR
jgi:putative flippase GtrA